MRILVLGSGAREHAIIRALLAEDAAHDITAAPGNAGIADDVRTLDLDANDGAAVASYAERHGVELVVVGPEAPLVAGVSDAVRERGIPVFGPSKAAARLEGSKAFAKRIMEAAGVPTGRAEVVGTVEEAEATLDRFGAPYVVKANGLAAGKGVLVTKDRDAALAHATYWLEHGTVLVEEFLDGREVSLFLLSDGEHVLPLSPAQDYKRLLDGDEGPNTGGMGAYSPVPWLDENFVDEVIDTVALPTIRAMAAEQTPFIGLLYCGLIVTDAGIRVIEFNARFGDPETQVVLPRLVTPLSGLLHAAATGELGGVPRPEFALDVAVGVVVASEGYPAAPVTGRAILGLDAASSIAEVQVLHAATDIRAVSTDATSSWSTETLVASGGRVLTVVALGSTFGQARERVYRAVDTITLEGSQHRTDIAAAVAPAAH
ncbi:phosphoribosylamine--glycine ligase [Humibacter ginsenosidimutans]|uniref:Phosphoribosylamine--glycine ligase n=1 Tax=Humibacter ginsenosidimutans TaxID=2599293 RepID=A0A5B8M600_9MICO|nr:phosphoribosylamine--glycine ligase [Humibacter ginsenosidimutans]QDZ15235.1 phosphoribosylamine--glycine ligase [Humibacter ginsenosidimutans]